jgi:hypothetical protein
MGRTLTWHWVIIENKKKETNWKKNFNLGREGNKVEKTMSKMNMNKTRGSTKKKMRNWKMNMNMVGEGWETKINK